MSDIRKEFEDLVKQYVKDLSEVNKDGLTSRLEVEAKTTELLDTLVDDLESKAEYHWYSSSSNC